MSCDCGQVGGVPHPNRGCHSCNGNPCRVSVTNTPECESLPSQIQNFTEQFFGTVIKTETDGVVTWSLPCDLDVGLPNNPRASDEGLACYFLRLFMDGIVGLKGDPGAKGDAGTDGKNAFTVTLGSFAQPTLANPNIQVLTSYNPAFMIGEYVFIATSGWYVITTADVSGTLFLTLTKELPGASGTITAGKLVVLAGYPGANGVGTQGPQGEKGDTGATGDSFTSVNGTYFAPVGVDFQLPVTYTAVNFINSSPAILLTSAGNYLFTVVADVVGLPSVALTDNAFLKLRNVSAASDIGGSEHQISNMVDTERKQIVLSCIVTTTTANQTVQLFGKSTTANKIAVVALNTSISYVRLGG